MRALQGVVGAEVLAVIVLLAMVLAPSDVAPPRLAGAGDAPAPGTAATASGDLGERDRSTQTAVEAPRERVEVRAGAGEIVLQGRLLGIENLPGAKVRLSCRRDGIWRYATVHDGRYAIADLDQGTWRVRCHGEGFVKLEFDHRITEAPLQRLDLPLEPSIVLPVFLHTIDGARLSTQLPSLSSQYLYVVAVEEPLTRDFAPTESSNVGDIGVGRYQDTASFRNVGADEPDGRLELDRSPPVHAVLLLRHMILAQQSIVPGQRELTFAIDVAAVKARFGTVRLRTVGPTGQPIAAHVHLMSAQGSVGRGAPPPDGIHVFEDVMPGVAQMHVQAEGFAGYSAHIMVPPSETLDLGDIVLSPPIQVRGRIVDEQGNGKGGRLEWMAPDRWRPPFSMSTRRYVSADGDGNFVLSLGPGRYVLRATSHDDRVGRAIVDTRSSSVAPFTVTVVVPTEVLLVADDSLETYAVVVQTNDGELLDTASIQPRWRESTLRLPPGDHSLEIHDGRGTLLRRMPLHVGTERLRVEVP